VQRCHSWDLFAIYHISSKTTRDSQTDFKVLTTFLWSGNKTHLWAHVLSAQAALLLGQMSSRPGPCLSNHNNWSNMVGFQDLAAPDASYFSTLWLVVGLSNCVQRHFGLQPLKTRLGIINELRSGLNDLLMSLSALHRPVLCRWNDIVVAQVQNYFGLIGK
jgi:hypothetical protein